MCNKAKMNKVHHTEMEVKMKWNKAAAFMGLFFCIAGGILFCAGKAAGGSNYLVNNTDFLLSQNHNQDNDIVTMKKTKISNYQNLQVNMKHLDLYILESDDDNYYMEYVLQKTKKESPFCYQYHGDTLTLTEKDGRTASYYQEIKIGIGATLLGMQNTKEYKNIILLYLPSKAKLEECQIELNKGDVEIKRLTAGSLNCSLESGDFSADNLSADVGNIILNDGDIDCDSTSLSKKLTMKSIDGYISLKILSKLADKVSIQGCTKEGNIEIAKKYKGNFHRNDETDTYCYTANEEDSLPLLSLYTEYGDIEIN